MQRSNYILLGYKACGKTALGRQLAANLNYAFLDLDEVFVQKHQQDIPTFVQQFGMPYFRHLEHQILHQLVLQQPTVIASGGGVVESWENQRYLSGLGLVIHIDLAYPIIVKHLLAMGRVPDFVSEAHFNSRRTLYQTWSAVTFARPYLGIEADALALLKQLRSKDGE